jgi:MFS family permease
MMFKLALFSFQMVCLDFVIFALLTVLGLGCVLGSYLTGRLLDRNYAKYEQDFRSNNPNSSENDICGTNPDFPIVHARLRDVWWVIGFFVVSTAAYGWTTNLMIAIPLVLQFISKSMAHIHQIYSNRLQVAFAATNIFTMNSTLLIDLYPGKPATATAMVSECFLYDANLSLINSFPEQPCPLLSWCAWSKRD